jgi:hypothetical protein
VYGEYLCSWSSTACEAHDGANGGSEEKDGGHAEQMDLFAMTRCQQVFDGHVIDGVGGEWGKLSVPKGGVMV